MPRLLRRDILSRFTTNPRRNAPSEKKKPGNNVPGFLTIIHSLLNYRQGLFNVGNNVFHILDSYR